MVAKKIPEILTLIDATRPEMLKTISVEETMESIIIRLTEPGKVITLSLNEQQAKKLQARLSKYFRDNR